MEPSNIIVTAMKLYQITNLNTYVLDQKDKLIYSHEVLSIPNFMPGSNQEDILQMHKRIEQHNHVYSYINEWGLHYFGLSFVKKTAVYSIIIGPYFDTTSNLYGLSIEYNLSRNQSEELRDVSDKIHVLSIEQANGFASVLQQFEAMLRTETFPTVIVADNQNGNEHKQRVNSTIDEEPEIIEVRYKIENDFMHAVEQGDKTAALKLISSQNPLFSFSERFPNQPLRGLKNRAIIMNTLLRVAARNGNVPAILIHRISESFAFEIEKARKLATLNQLQDHMIVAYCDLVVENALSNYSKLTQKVIEYLQNFYDKQIDKKEIAKLFNTHPGHLSRKFKQETNLTITAYQQMLRVNKAKHLLKSENLTIEEIAWIVGYDDSSYFSRVFKKETGTSPSQYRDMGTGSLSQFNEGGD